MTKRIAILLGAAVLITGIGTAAWLWSMDQGNISGVIERLRPPVCTQDLGAARQCFDGTIVVRSETGTAHEYWYGETTRIIDASGADSTAFLEPGSHVSLTFGRRNGQVVEIRAGR